MAQGQAQGPGPGLGPWAHRLIIYSIKSYIQFVFIYIYMFLFVSFLLFIFPLYVVMLDSSLYHVNLCKLIFSYSLYTLQLIFVHLFILPIICVVILSMINLIYIIILNYLLYCTLIRLIRLSSSCIFCKLLICIHSISSPSGSKVAP